VVKPKGALVVIGFNYGLLGTELGDTVRLAADRIRSRIKKTVMEIIEVGCELLAVRKALPHGHFLSWLKFEFHWSERAAQYFMSVAENFKSANFADLHIRASACFLLAAPSVPEEAREKAIAKAEAGEEITLALAKRIIADARKNRPRTFKNLSCKKLGRGLEKVLERYRERWEPKKREELARQLREFADSIDN
jgi:Protein of unknown function (DUF3102)